MQQRGLKISKEQLIEFERLGIFFPFARVRPATNIQWFWKEQVNGLFEVNALEQPSLTTVDDQLKPEDEGKEFRSYYSVFQVYSVFDLLRAVERLTISPLKLQGLTKKDAATLLSRAARSTSEIFSQYKN